MYKIVFTKKALKDLEKINAETKTMIGNKIKTLMDNAHTDSELETIELFLILKKIM